LRRHALAAWAAVERGEPNPLVSLLAGDAAVTSLLQADRVRQILTAPLMWGMRRAWRAPVCGYQPSVRH